MFKNAGSGTTVRSVLGLEIFRRAEAYVAAGEDDLDRALRWVHAAEIPDIAQFLSGGELLLTAGQGLGRSEDEQRSYIRSIAKVGVAGLAVELAGRVFERFPDAVVDEAEQQGVPLIGLRHEVPFVEASAQILELLAADRVRESERTVEVNRVLTERLVAGADHISLVRCLAEIVGRPILLESADHEVQGYYSMGEDSQGLLADWSAHARSVAVHSPTGDAPGQCLRRPVVVQGATWGWLHMPWDETCSHSDQIVVEQGASAIAISMLHERVSGARSRHQQGILINRLMLGDVNGKGFVDRALRFGKDLRDAPMVIVIAGSTDAESSDLEHEVSADLRGTRLTSVTADIGEAVLSVVALRGERAMEMLTRALRSETRFLGFSKVVSADELPIALKQARAAFFARQPCQFFDRLGILRLLVPLSNGPELAAFVEDELGALLQYDHEHDTQLFPTLSAFLENDGNKTLAAQQLYIQRRTLYYRLERISQIIGLDLEDGETRLRLRVAISAAELLRNTRVAPKLTS